MYFTFLVYETWNSKFA